MRIILQREVEKLGLPGDVVEVADGYARNYLIPRGLASRVTKGAVQHSQQLRRAHDQRVRRALDEARAVADRLMATRLRVRARAGEGGRLFGSITAADLTRELSSSTGVSIDRHQVHLPDPIRSVGSHEVVVHLHPEVNATVSVEVVPQ